MPHFGIFVGLSSVFGDSVTNPTKRRLNQHIHYIIWLRNLFSHVGCAITQRLLPVEVQNMPVLRPFFTSPCRCSQKLQNHSQTTTLLVLDTKSNPLIMSLVLGSTAIVALHLFVSENGAKVNDDVYFLLAFIFIWGIAMQRSSGGKEMPSFWLSVTLFK